MCEGFGIYKNPSLDRFITMFRDQIYKMFRINKKYKEKFHVIDDIDGLTHWGRDKVAAIFQTTFSNAFSL